MTGSGNSDAALVREAITDWSRDTREWKLNVGDVEQALARLAAAAERADKAKLRWYEGDIPDGSARIKELEAALEFVTGVLVQAHVSDISEREYQAAIDVANAALAPDAEQGNG